MAKRVKVTNRCNPRGITNRDGSCAVVAVLQLLRKTGLYRHINEELKVTIESLMVQGWHDFTESACPRVPSAIWERYKEIGGGDNMADDGADVYWLIRAIVHESPMLNNKVTVKKITDTGTDECSAWRSQPIFNHVVNTMSAKVQERDFMFGCMDGTYNNPDVSAERDKTLDPKVIADGCSQLRILVNYLLNFKDIGITAGVMGYTWPKSEHAVTFVRCENDFHFFNWGDKITGTEIQQFDDKRICKWMTRSRKNPFSIDQVIFLWEKELFSRVDLIGPDLYIPSSDEVGKLREIITLLYGRNLLPGGVTRLQWLEALDADQTRLLEWYMDNMDQNHKYDLIAYVWGCWGVHQRAVDKRRKQPNAAQSAIAHEIHEYATAHKIVPPRVSRKRPMVDELLSKRRNRAIVWDDIPFQTMDELTPAELVHFKSLAAKRREFVTTFGIPPYPLFDFIMTKSWEEQKVWIHTFPKEFRTSNPNFQAIVTAHRDATSHAPFDDWALL
jgi:hypothetical protein